MHATSHRARRPAAITAWAGALICLGSSTRPARAATPDHPRKPVRVAVPSAPGGGTDIVARVLARKLAQTWPQPVVVDNVSGGATSIGTEVVARAAADGRALLMTGVNLTLVPLLDAKVPDDVRADLEPCPSVSSDPVEQLNINEMAALARFAAVHCAALQPPGRNATHGTISARSPGCLSPRSGSSTWPEPPDRACASRGRRLLHDCRRSRHPERIPCNDSDVTLRYTAASAPRAHR